MKTDYEDYTLQQIIDQFKKNKIYIARMEEIIYTEDLSGEDFEQAHKDFKVFISDQLVLGYEFLKRHV